jgi:AraC family transcriptional regulator
MYTNTDLLGLAYKMPLMQEDIISLLHIEKEVPGSVTYNIQRFKKLAAWQFDDTGILIYHQNPINPTQNYLEIKFCVTGNVFCREKKKECDFCRNTDSTGCVEHIDSVDVLSFKFTPNYLTQFKKASKNNNLVEHVLTFTHPQNFTKTLPLCRKTRTAIEALLNHNYTDTLENIFINAQVQMLLLYSVDCMLNNHQHQPTIFECKFLANADDREKIYKAREILLEHIGDPLTIKALSRKVAINECYLKKGFKELFGTTVFDFYQTQRMEHAKYLLYDKGLSVTDVSGLLGYSSISHFSTAFKKHTGIKPCELLVH